MKSACVAASITEGSLSETAARKTGTALVACRSPRVAAAAARTRGFLSRMARSENLSAWRLPASRESAFTCGLWQTRSIVLTPSFSVALPLKYLRENSIHISQSAVQLERTLDYLCRNAPRQFRIARPEFAKVQTLSPGPHGMSLYQPVSGFARYPMLH